MYVQLVSFLLILLLAYLPGEVQTPPLDDVPKWELLEDSPSGGRGRHDDVYFVNPSLGFLVSTRGRIWKTTDSGDSWTSLVDTSPARFRSVGFANDLVGWSGTVYSPEQALMETRDGGETWTNITDRISGSPPAGICGISVVSQDVVFGVGAFFGEPVVIKTSDGGQSWTSLSLAGIIATLIDVHFFDEQNGIATGGTGSDLDGEAVVLRTTDGGDTWSRVFTSARKSGINGEWGWKISFPTPETGYVSVEYISNNDNRPAKVLKTTNGGATWSELEIPGSTDQSGLQGIGFSGPEIGWASGRGTTSITEDGGQTWTQLAHTQDDPEGQLDGRVNRIRVVNDTLAFAIGQRVYRLRGRVDTASGFEPAAVREPEFVLKQNYPNPFTESTTIEYVIFRSAGVRVTVHDMQGRLIKTLLDQVQPPGEYQLNWDGMTDSGEKTASGVYFYLIDGGDSQEMKQLVQLK